MSGWFGGEARGGAAAPAPAPGPATHPRYIPKRGLVLRGVLGSFFCFGRSAKTCPLPRLQFASMSSARSSVHHTESRLCNRMVLELCESFLAILASFDFHVSLKAASQFQVLCSIPAKRRE
ncbi:hypothetical protein GUJ93_ZPchr0002g23298 [Zizania palustris]|uniref:Uncharacterized protein n=1 Tax=Zizania palustris TaxID=103762 RepID=A0A8J5RWD7_ZIZPA|nr:hypothetical protein GUJ93_ZPchr0002g23298 [Zizania palustris]